jgi:hypothetical protein
MILQSLLWMWLFCQSILALSIPQHNTQQLLVPVAQATSATARTSVILAFTGDGSDQVHQVQVALQKHIPSGR